MRERSCLTCGNLVLQKLDAKKPRRYCDQCRIERQKLSAARADLKRQYGITPEYKLNLRISQAFACAICERSEAEIGRDLVVDHCHTTGKIRGALCHSCNRSLGLLRDDPGVLFKAFRYLMKDRKNA
jgi:hypothetical protein